MVKLSTSGTRKRFDTATVYALLDICTSITTTNIKLHAQEKFWLSLWKKDFTPCLVFYLLRAKVKKKIYIHKFCLARIKTSSNLSFTS